jgi:hypothetical protein
MGEKRTDETMVSYGGAVGFTGHPGCVIGAGKR